MRVTRITENSDRAAAHAPPKTPFEPADMLPYEYIPLAGMAELADAADSKSAGLRPLGVRLPLPAPAAYLSAKII
jgi:hypothetical protein